MGRLTASQNWLAMRCWQFAGTDPEVLRYGAWISLWARWFVWLAVVVELTYRPETWFPAQSYFLLVHGPLVLFNGLLHYAAPEGHTRWLLWRCIPKVSAEFVACSARAL